MYRVTSPILNSKGGLFVADESKETGTCNQEPFGDDGPMKGGERGGGARDAWCWW